VAGDAILAALHMGEMQLPPAHAVGGNAMIHPVGVLEAIGQAVVQAVVAVDTDVRSPFFSCDFFIDKHETNSPKTERTMLPIC
jgi:hypothetical protein